MADSGARRAAHTPGPWEWKHPFNWEGSYILLGADGTVVCDDGSAYGEYSREIDPEGDECNQANARLIAAAPELLAALKKISAKLENIETLLNGYEHDIKKIADDAIRKVEAGDGKR